MIIIFFIFLTTVFANSYEKYIDLLPAVEKQQFLEHVARRIMENVESKENENKFSRELTDDQLKAHNDFVQSILEQESLQMRQNKGGEKIVQDKMSNENFEVKPLQAVSSDRNKDDTDINQVDLTINDIKRRSYDNSVKEPVDDVIQFDVGDEDLSINKRSIKTDGAVTTFETTTDGIADEELTTQFQNVTIESNTDEIEEKITTRSSKLEVISKELDTDASFENSAPMETKENISDIMYNSTYTTHITSTATTPKSEDTGKKLPTTHLSKLKLMDSNITYIQQRRNNIPAVETVKEIKNISEAKETFKSSEFEDDYPADNEQKSYNRTLTSTLSDENTIADMTETTDFETTIETMTSESPPNSGSLSETTLVPITSNTSVSNAYDNSTESISALKIAKDNDKENEETITEIDLNGTVDQIEIETSTNPVETTTESALTTTLLVPALTPTHIEEQTTKKPRKNKSKLKHKANATLSDIASNALKKVKERYKKQQSSKNYEEFKHFQEAQENYVQNFVENDTECQSPPCKRYRVYEVDWPSSAEDQPAVLRESDAMLDQPHYVPVYNYSPDNVYYNPQNRLGPNPVEENSIEIDTGMLRSGNRDDDNIPQSEFIFDLNTDLMRKFGIYGKSYKPYRLATHPPTKVPKKKKKKIRRTTTKAPSDENVTETSFIFPNSDEETHPYNSLKGGMKNHIRVVRNVLFNNKHLQNVNHDHDAEDFLYGNENKKIDILRTGPDNKLDAKHIDIDFYSSRIKDKKPSSHKNKDFLPRAVDDVKLFFINMFGSRGYLNPFKHKSSYKNKNKKEIDQKIEENLNKYTKYEEKIKTKVDKNKIKSIYNKYKTKNRKTAKTFAVRKIQNRIKASKNTKKVKSGFLDYLSAKYINNEMAKQNKNDTEANKFNTIAKILSLSPTDDFFINLKKMQDMNLKLMRRNNDVKFDSYIDELRNMIARDDNALKQYNWLDTTVQIQSALTKLLELINIIRESRPVHPADVQILKYTVFLHNFATEIRKASGLGGQLRKGLVFPRNRNLSDKFIKEKGLINRVWLYLRTLMPDLTAEDELTNLNQFIMNIADGLYGLHTALKNIGTITKFKKQNWYQNLKDLYLSTDEKQLKEVLLHISVARLFSLIEYSCQNGLEDDFVEFMKTHKEVAKRTLEEMLFVTKIVDQINKISV